MTNRKRATPTYGWAALGKRSGKILRDLDGQYSTWTNAEAAANDCPSWGRVARVVIREVKR